MAVMLMLLWQPLQGAVVSSEIDIERIRTNITALDRIRNGVVARQGAQSPADGEQQLLLAFLEGRIAEECAHLRQQGISVAGLPCPAAKAQLPQGTAATSAEQVAALDRELQGLLGQFDEMLLTEQERISRRKQKTGSSGQGGAGGQDNGQNGSDATATSGTQAAAAGQDTGLAGQQNGDGRPRKPGQAAAAATGHGEELEGDQKNGTSPGRDRLGTDDDIVARQLREAAEKEQDPELKKKLWQEYRRYKEGH